MELEDSSLKLIHKIEERVTTICVLGLGQVGLPTAVSFLNIGYKVIGYDVNKKLIEQIKHGVSPIPESGFNDLMLKFIENGMFTATTSPDVLQVSDVIIICVATPLNTSSLTADMSFLKKALDSVARYLDSKKLIVIESTIPPKTMREFVIPNLEQLTGKKAGKDFLISFCPERIAPGNALYEFSNNPRVIGADDEDSYLASKSLFSKLTRGGLHRVDTATAEISKLAENTYRDINIALANELAIICEQNGVDVLDVISIANTHPRVSIHKPGPGVGGPCLPKDPYLLLMKNKADISLVKIARSINDAMPTHVVKTVVKLIESKNIESKNNHQSKDNLSLAILGVSYKANVNDTRYSPTERIVSELMEMGFNNITVHDPYSTQAFGAKFSSDLNLILQRADCVIIATAHSEYSSLTSRDFRRDCIIMDAARILNKMEFMKNDVSYYALGA